MFRLDSHPKNIPLYICKSSKLPLGPRTVVIKHEEMEIVPIHFIQIDPYTQPIYTQETELTKWFNQATETGRTTKPLG